MDEQKLDRLISEYLQASERGESVNPQQLIAQNPQFADELRSFFEGKRVFDAALGQASAADEMTGATTTVEGSRGQSQTASRIDARRDASRVYIRDYQLLEKLGEGGMGAVFLALHTQLQKRVAIKVLKSELESDLSAKKRFQNEMRAVGRFEHDNIVRALDAGRTKEGYYLVMEFIEGTNLSQLLRRCGPLQIADACEVIRQTANGLAHAHYLGIIHRDVKPSNLMLTPSGKIKVLDLGLAQLRLAHLTSELTVDGHVLGTLKYMPPEQLEGKKVDQTCDVYSLGVTLLELVLGDLPPIAVGHGIDWSRLNDRCQFVPVELIALIQQMTAVDRSQRPQSASEVAESLQQWSSESDLVVLFRAFREQSDDNPVDSGIRPPQAPPVHASSASSIPRWERKQIATIAVCCLVGLFLATVVYRSNRPDPVVVPAGPIDATLSIILEPGTVADPSNPLPVLIHRTTGDAFRLSEGPNELPPGSYSMESDRWESSVSFPITLDEGAQRSTLLSPTTWDGPPVHLPEIPKQPGSWVTYTAHRVISSPPAAGERESAGEQTTHSYTITLRSLQQEKIDDKTYRWIEIEIVNSEYAETARLLIDETLYDLEQRLSIHEGYIESTVLDAASGISNLIGPRPVLRWSDDVDPFEELADYYRVTLPASRISTASLLSMIFGLVHPAVPAVFNDMRSLLGSSTSKSVEETTFKSEKGYEMPALKITASGAEQESNTGYTIVRGKNLDQAPFSFLHVHIKVPNLQVTLDRYNWRSTGDVSRVNREQMESHLLALDEIDEAAGEDFVRASLPEKEGDYAEYVATVTQPDGTTTVVTTVVRAGGKETYRGNTCRWIEVRLDEQERDRVTTEKVCLLVDENAYRDNKKFTFYRGWLQLGGETFDFFDGDATPAEQALVWLKKDVKSQRLRVHEVLTLLFDAQLPSSTMTRPLRIMIENARVANFHEQSSVQSPLWVLHPVRDKTEPVRCKKVVLGPLGLKNQSLKYTLLWSRDVPFGFALVDLSSQSSDSTRSRSAFAVTTSLVNYGFDRKTLIGNPEVVRMEAAQTLQKLQRLNVRLWEANDQVHAGQFESGSYDKGTITLKLVRGAANFQFENLARADQQWILENESVVWPRLSGETIRGIFHDWLHSEGKVRILSVDNEFKDLPRNDFSPDILRRNTDR